MDIFENENSRRSQTSDWMNLFSDAGGGSDFGNIGNFGIPDGSIFEGMVPGGLESVGIRTTPEEINAIANLPSGGFDLGRLLRNLGSKAVDYVSNNPGQVGLMAALAALGAANKAPPSGGGTTKRYTGPAQQLTRTVEQGRYGPIAKFRPGPAIQYATPADPGDPYSADGLYGGVIGVPTSAAERAPAFANGELAQFAERTRREREAQNRVAAEHAYAMGGIMHAYANGGQVRPFPMQDGGFVMTKKAVDGAGGQGGLRSILPEAQPIQGPGHGTSDSIPAYIQGQNGKTPAKVSNGESYVPPGRNTREMYALMKYLEGMGRRA